MHLFVTDFQYFKNLTSNLVRSHTQSWKTLHNNPDQLLHSFIKLNPFVEFNYEDNKYEVIPGLLLYECPNSHGQVL